MGRRTWVLSVGGVRFEHMIESRVRELVGEVLSADDSGAFRERLDRISELDHAVVMLQTACAWR